MHDFWGEHDQLPCKHARCNDHLLRELKASSEAGHRWSEQIIKALLAMKKLQMKPEQKAKNPGCFRSEEGAERFCILSSYIASHRKEGDSLMESIKSAFNK